MDYVEMEREHPFLEQTVMNLAMWFRQTKQLSQSLQMWAYLLKIQQKLYGVDKEIQIYTLKNIGICYLGLGMPEMAEE